MNTPLNDKPPVLHTYLKQQNDIETIKIMLTVLLIMAGIAWSIGECYLIAKISIWWIKYLLYALIWLV